MYVKSFRNARYKRLNQSILGGGVAHAAKNGRILAPHVLCKNYGNKERKPLRIESNVFLNISPGE